MNRRQRRQLSKADKAKAQDAYARWYQDRYRNHRAYSSAELRGILIDDAIARRATPIQWALDAYATIAQAEKVDQEVVFAQVRQACLDATGLDMPFAGTH